MTRVSEKPWLVHSGLADDILAVICGLAEVPDRGWITTSYPQSPKPTPHTDIFYEVPNMGSRAEKLAFLIAMAIPPPLSVSLHSPRENLGEGGTCRIFRLGERHTADA